MEKWAVWGEKVGKLGFYGGEIFENHWRGEKGKGSI